MLSCIFGRSDRNAIALVFSIGFLSWFFRARPEKLQAVRVVVGSIAHRFENDSRVLVFSLFFIGVNILHLLFPMAGLSLFLFILELSSAK